jgi:hypothetical protein
MLVHRWNSIVRVLWRLTNRSFIDGSPETTPGNVKLLLPPRQSRGNSQGSKYPPAKPGALNYWPLKAAGQVADATCGM